MDQQQILAFVAQLIAQLFHAAPAAPAGPPVGKVPIPTAPVAPAAAGPIMVQLGVVTVRRQGEIVTDEVMGAGGVLMARDKIFLDSSELYEDGSPVPPSLVDPPEDILWSFYYGSEPEPDLVVRGDAARDWKGDLSGKHWLVSHQGAVKLGESGHAIVAKLAEGDPGTSKWQVTCSHDGVASNPVGGRAD
jgi:hypothetical protein